MQEINKNQNLDMIKYGDLLITDKQKISCNDRIIQYFFITGLMQQFFNLKPPANSSQETYHELKYLEKITNSTTKEDLEFAAKADTQEERMYVLFSESIGLPITESFFKDIFSQIEPILFLLKNHFNRPRPFQLGPILGIQVAQKVPYDAFHPAYPSGHALDAYIVEYVLTKIAPSKAKEIKHFTTKMAESRINIGIHYPSDNVISKKLADTIIKHNLVKVPSIS